jgi:hypothetical protein
VKCGHGQNTIFGESIRNLYLLLRILDDRKKLTIWLIISALVMYQIQKWIIFPFESLLNFEVTQHASMVYLPAGIIFLSFYLLRWWFLPVILISRMLISLEFSGLESWVEVIILNGCIALLYPLWLSLLNSANWDVFGDKDQSQLTITGAMIFALLISFSSGILSAIQQTFLGAVPMEQALQYTVHFVVGDTLGTGVVIFLFYKLLQLNIRTRNK